MEESKVNNSQENQTQNEIETLRLQLEEYRAKSTQAEDALLRAKAENENLRKRFTREAEENRKHAISNFAYDLIESIENLHRATDSIPSEETAEYAMLKQYVEGIALTKKLLIEVLTKHGITRIYPLNQPFDHTYHQAIMQVQNDNVPPNTVVQVISAGYMIQDKLLKEALVGVSKHGGELSLMPEPNDQEEV